MDTEMESLKRKLSIDDADARVNSSENSETVNEENMENDDDHLRQFDVLDEVQGDESGSENGDIEQKCNNQT